MEHGLTLITTLAAAFVIALALGFVAERLKIPALVGYLVAGIAVSPATPGFVADIQIASQLSEVGIMLLMFGVGLHFSLSDLLRVKYVAVPGAIIQMGVATALGAWVAHFWNWPIGECIVFGICLSCASTVVLLKALESRGILESQDGQIAVGWLVVEDLMTVLILVLLPPMASLLGGDAGTALVSDKPLWLVILWTIAQVAIFIFLMLVIGKRFLPWLLWQVAKTGSRELFTLCVLAVAIGIAYGASEIFHISFALGAFFSGMVMRESKYAHRAAVESLPLRDAFSVIFFVGVGMMFEPAILVDEPLRLLVVLAIIIVGKSLVAFILVMCLRYPLHSALTVAVALSQIGEFSFILAGVGASLGLMAPQATNLVLAGAILSIAFNPIMFAAEGPIRRFLKAHWKFARVADAKPDPMSVLPDEIETPFIRGHIVLVGYGNAGPQILQDLKERKIAAIVIDKDRGIVEDLRKVGFKAVWGDATEPGALIQAHVQDAALIVINLLDDLESRKIIETTKLLNTKLEVVLTTNNEENAMRARADHLGKVFVFQDVMAMAVARYCMIRFGRKEEEQRFEEEKEAEQAAEERLAH